MRPLLVLLALAACDNDNKVTVYDDAPAVSIASPPDGGMVDEGTLDFTGTATDRETPNEELQVAWSSTVSGVLGESVPDPDGTVTFATSVLTVGLHTLTLAATDEAGNRTEYSIQLTVQDVPEAPTIEIVHPISGETARDDVAFSFAAKVADAQDTGDQLQVRVESEATGAVCSGTADLAGDFVCTATLSALTHYLTFTVTDSSSLESTAQAALTVASYTTFDDDGDGWTEAQGDCDDANPAILPFATESYNGIDDDCDGLVDEGTPGYDDDGDGYTELDNDCDDDDATAYPGAGQVYDGADNDCDGTVDDETAWYDDDGDGYTETAGDCDDTSLAVYPGAPELEDGADNDCDTVVDEGTAAYDDDGDGYTENGGDCDDADVDDWPGAPEDYTDAVDQDCNGTAELDVDGDGHLATSTGGDDCDDTEAETFPGAAEAEADPTLCRADADLDGWGDDAPPTGVDAGEDCDDGDDAVSPDGLEECDGADNDCDGTADEANADGCATYYYDYDGDGFGSDAVAGQCLCSTSGYYTSAYDTDCYDNDATAAPGETAYHTSDRGDGSYDWNCSGTEEKYYGSAYSCPLTSLCTLTEGWRSGVASCGTSASYVTGCSLNIYTISCTTTSGSKTQKCR